MACRRRNRLLVGRAHRIRLAVAATGKRPDGLPATVIGASPVRWEEGPRPWRVLESWALYRAAAGHGPEISLQGSRGVSAPASLQGTLARPLFSPSRL